MDIREHAQPEAAIISRRSGLVVAITILLANAINYAFQIVSGRLLSVDEYGLFAGFMAAITIIAVSTSALQTTAARSVAARENDPTNRRRVDGLTKTAILLGAVVCLVVIAAAPVASRFLNIGVIPILMLGLYVVPSALDSIAAGRLQGSQRFTGLALYTLCQAAARVACALVLVAVGLRVGGLLGGVAISTFSIALLGLRSTRPLGAVNTHALSPEVRRSFAAVFLFWFSISIDVVFARAFFEPAEAGIYAAAAVLGKAVLWVPLMIIQLLFPHLADRSTRGQAVGSVLGRVVALVLMLTALATAALYVFGDMIFSFLYGDRYDGAADIAWKIGLAMMPLAVVNLLLFHYLARGQGRFLWFMTAAAIGEVIVLYAGPQSGAAYAAILGAVGMVLLILMLPWRSLRRFTPTQRNRSPLNWR